MKDLLGMLEYAEVTDKTEALAIAKGLYYLPKTLKEVHNRNKKTIAWQMRDTRLS